MFWCKSRHKSKRHTIETLIVLEPQHFSLPAQQSRKWAPQSQNYPKQQPRKLQEHIPPAHPLESARNLHIHTKDLHRRNPLHNRKRITEPVFHLATLNQLMILTLSLLDATPLDSHDPAFAARLNALGVVPPNPFLPLTEQQHQSRTTPATSSPSIPTNPALLVLRAREALQRAYDEEEAAVGRTGFQGRRFVEAARMGEALRLRASGIGEADVERRLGLARGVLGRLSGGGVVGVVATESATAVEGR
jgi:hypothetical protein